MWFFKGPSSVWGPNTQLQGSCGHKSSFVPVTILSPNPPVTKTHNLIPTPSMATPVHTPATLVVSSSLFPGDMSQASQHMGLGYECRFGVQQRHSLTSLGIYRVHRGVLGVCSCVPVRLGLHGQDCELLCQRPGSVTDMSANLRDITPCHV